MHLETEASPRSRFPVQPRSNGALVLTTKHRSGQTVIDRFRTSGATKTSFPRNRSGLEAIVVNTSGGVTGGDRFRVEATAGAACDLTLTTQAAERVYRSTLGVARVRSRLRVSEDAFLSWLPQETILFENAALDRRLSIELAPGGRLLMAEPVIFGRSAMGERLRSAHFRDRIEIWRKGVPLYRDSVNLSGDLDAAFARKAIAAGAGAMACAVFVSDTAAARLDQVRRLLPATGGASLLRPDLLVLRILAADGFLLRTSLVPILELLKDHELPRSWSL